MRPFRPAGAPPGQRRKILPVPSWRHSRSRGDGEARRAARGTPDAPGSQGRDAAGMRDVRWTRGCSCSGASGRGASTVRTAARRRCAKAAVHARARGGTALGRAQERGLGGGACGAAAKLGRVWSCRTGRRTGATRASPASGVGRIPATIFAAQAAAKGQALVSRQSGSEGAGSQHGMSAGIGATCGDATSSCCATMSR